MNRFEWMLTFGEKMHTSLKRRLLESYSKLRKVPAVLTAQSIWVMERMVKVPPINAFCAFWMTRSKCLIEPTGKGRLLVWRGICLLPFYKYLDSRILYAF